MWSMNKKKISNWFNFFQIHKFGKLALTEEKEMVGDPGSSDHLVSGKIISKFQLAKAFVFIRGNVVFCRLFRDRIVKFMDLRMALVIMDFEDIFAANLSFNLGRLREACLNGLLLLFGFLRGEKEYLRKVSPCLLV